MCADHSKTFVERMPCRCGGCNDVDDYAYCLPCVIKYEPTNYNTEDD